MVGCQWNFLINHLLIPLVKLKRILLELIVDKEYYELNNKLKYNFENGYLKSNISL